MSALGPGPQAPAPETVELILRAGGHHKSAERTDISAGVAGAVNASRQVLAGGDVEELIGWSLRETTGAAAAEMRLRDGNSAAGEVLAVVGLAANTSSFVFASGRGVRVLTGRVFLEVVSGSVEGVVYWK